MILLNFGHPLTHDQLEELEERTGHRVARVVAVQCDVDPGQPLTPHVVELADRCNLSTDEWQGTPLLVNPPSLNFVAVALLVELHGRCGYFPAHLRLRPVKGAIPSRYEVAEVLDLQGVREAARRRR